MADPRRILAADAVVVVIMTNAAVVRIGVRGGDGEAENGQTENGKQNLFHGNLLKSGAPDCGTLCTDATARAVVSCQTRLISGLKMVARQI